MWWWEIRGAREEKWRVGREQVKRVAFSAL
jgi:hypothetical protein